jgi:hypothetical protein
MGIVPIILNIIVSGRCNYLTMKSRDEHPLHAVQFTGRKLIPRDLSIRLGNVGCSIRLQKVKFSEFKHFIYHFHRIVCKLTTHMQQSSCSSDSQDCSRGFTDCEHETANEKLNWASCKGYILSILWYFV